MMQRAFQYLSILIDRRLLLLRLLALERTCVLRGHQAPASEGALQPRMSSESVQLVQRLLTTRLCDLQQTVLRATRTWVG